MHETQWLAERFEADRMHPRSVACRMLGSPSEAEDAVQEAWLRLSRSSVGDVETLPRGGPGWARHRGGFSSIGGARVLPPWNIA